MFKNALFLILVSVVNFCFSNVFYDQLIDDIDIVVSKDGSGDYRTVGEAVDACSTGDLIFVRSGTYFEKVEIPSNKSAIYLVGEDVDNTIIEYNDYSGSGSVYNGIISFAVGNAIGTSTSHTLYVGGDDFTMMNITIKNSAGEVGQAVAYNTRGDRNFLYHCKFLGNQDTYYTWTNGRVFNLDCYIEGTVDYIFGGGAVFFDQCQLNTIRSSGYITAAATDEGFKFGYVFNNCKLTAPVEVSNVFLGRPWKAFGQTVFINSDEGINVNPLGWRQWNGNENTCFYAEYDNCGAGSNVTDRESWSRQLTIDEAASYTVGNVFKRDVNPNLYSSDWLPSLSSHPLSMLLSSLVTPFVMDACFVDVVNYDCNGVIDGVAELDQCGVCVGGNTGVDPCTGSVGGEDFCDALGVIESVNLGYVGDGYLNFDNTVDAYAGWTIMSDYTGLKEIVVRYANGGVSDRNMNVYVNGVLQTMFLGKTTGDWGKWGVEALELNLMKGLNSVKFTSVTSDGGPNIDVLGFVTSGLSAAGCVMDCNGVVGGDAYLDNCEICVGGSTNKEACLQDCGGSWGGASVVDGCGACLSDDSILPCVGVVEAESACAFEGTVDSDNTGFFGDGFVNTINSYGAGISWLLSSEDDRIVTLSFRYANGGIEARNGELSIGGEVVSSLLLPSTGSWSVWDVVSINVSLKKGVNDLMVTAISDDGLANLDVLSYSYGVSASDCMITGSKKSYVSLLSVFPNPTNGIVKWLEVCEWKLVNSNGLTLMEGESDFIDLSFYEDGVYFLMSKDGVVKKVLKY